jgi:hypothetical protein
MRDASTALSMTFFFLSSPPPYFTSAIRGFGEVASFHGGLP